jgi:hypothetical protein
MVDEERCGAIGRERAIVAIMAALRANGENASSRRTSRVVSLGESD